MAQVTGLKAQVAEIEQANRPVVTGGTVMSDPTALAQLLTEHPMLHLGKNHHDGTVEGYAAGFAEAAKWLIARGVRVLPSEPSEAAVDAASFIIKRDVGPVSFSTAEEVLRAAYAVDAAPRPEEP